MRKRVLFWPAATVVSVLAAYTLGAAQQQQQQQQIFWYVSEYRIDWRQADSLQKLLRTYTLPAIEEARRAGNLLEEKWLVHHTGDEYNVMQVRRLRSWDAMNADTSFQAAFRRQVPDSARRAGVNRAFGDIFQANPHRDRIYVEVTR